jgi:hypothetical protein
LQLIVVEYQPLRRKATAIAGVFPARMILVKRTASKTRV